MARVALLLTKLCRFCPAQPMPVSGPSALSTIKLSGHRARKTGVIFFTNSHTDHQYPSHIWLADPSQHLEYHVEDSNRTNTIWYLGIFFDHQLNWKDHVHASWPIVHAPPSKHSTSSATPSVGLMGPVAHHQIIFNAMALPILTYIAPELQQPNQTYSDLVFFNYQDITLWTTIILGVLQTRSHLQISKITVDLHVILIVSAQIKSSRYSSILFY